MQAEVNSLKKQVATLRRQVTELQTDKSSLQADTSSIRMQLETAERARTSLQQTVTRVEEERKRAVDALEMVQKLYNSETQGTPNGTTVTGQGSDPDSRPSFIVGPDMPDEGMYNSVRRPIQTGTTPYGEPDHEGGGCCSNRRSSRGICSTGGGGCSLM